MRKQLNSELLEFQQLTDELLVDLIRCDAAKSDLARTELFSRYYPNLDATVRRVLLSYGWKYEPAAGKHWPRGGRSKKQNR